MYFLFYFWQKLCLNIHSKTCAEFPKRGKKRRNYPHRIFSNPEQFRCLSKRADIKSRHGDLFLFPFPPFLPFSLALWKIKKSWQSHLFSVLFVHLFATGKMLLLALLCSGIGFVSADSSDDSNPCIEVLPFATFPPTSPSFLY
jgi:hypothetical protein